MTSPGTRASGIPAEYAENTPSLVVIRIRLLVTALPFSRAVALSDIRARSDGSSVSRKRPLFGGDCSGRCRSLHSKQLGTVKPGGLRDDAIRCRPHPFLDDH